MTTSIDITRCVDRPTAAKPPSAAKPRVRRAPYSPRAAYKCAPVRGYGAIAADPMQFSELCAPAAMNIGDLVIYRGEIYYLRGLDPMSVSDRQADLEALATGERLKVPLEEVEPAPPQEATCA